MSIAQSSQCQVSIPEELPKIEQEVEFVSCLRYVFRNASSYQREDVCIVAYEGSYEIKIP
eukprot:scaffold4463_cov51-Attheya_sp.AAC.3